MHKNGLTGKNWKIVKEINSNLTAKIRTKHGLTRPINIKDSIRQGGVLSVIEYANLIDEIAKELEHKHEGYQEIWDYTTLGCLLWMDDVVLIHHDKEELQKMLNTTNDIARRFHIKFGREKSQLLTIGNAEPPPEMKLGNDVLDKTDTYRYLGMTINSSGNLESHINKIKGKTEAAIQTIFNLAGNEEFRTIEMSTIWKLVQTCLIPIITYGAETWVPTKAEIKRTQRILDNCIKRILRTPITTPSEIITAETGIWDIETQVAKKQILTIENPESQLYKSAMEPKNPWRKKVERTIKELNIQLDDLLTKNKIQAKKCLTSKLREYQTNKIYKAAKNKSKVRDYVCNKTRKAVMEKPDYIDKLSRKECSSIFNTRARMIKVKGNYKSMHEDMTCRWCKKEDETQVHILKYCPEFKNLTNNTNQEMYYRDDRISARKTAEILQKVIKKIERD